MLVGWLGVLKVTVVITCMIVLRGSITPGYPGYCVYYVYDMVKKCGIMVSEGQFVGIFVQ